MEKTKSSIKHFCVIIFVLQLLCTNYLITYAQNNLNTVTFENQSGELALVKLIGPTFQNIEVPNNQSPKVYIAPGDYYILIRYGSEPSNYRYAKGDPFAVIQTATQYSSINITLHKVIGGEYQTIPSNAEEFEKAVVAAEDEVVSEKESVLLTKLINIEKKRAIEWIKNNNKFGPESKIVETFTKILESAISNDEGKIWWLGWGLTKSNKAYQFKWIKGKFHVIELTPAEAKQKGIEEMKISGAINIVIAEVSLPPKIRITNVQIGDDSGKLNGNDKISGQLDYEIISPLNSQETILLKYVIGNKESINSQFFSTDSLDKKGTLKFSFPPVNHGRRQIPFKGFLDLFFAIDEKLGKPAFREIRDSDFEIISNEIIIRIQIE